VASSAVGGPTKTYAALDALLAKLSCRGESSADDPGGYHREMERFDPLHPRRSLGLLDPQVRDLGWVSFFADLSSEIVYPLFPVFITVVLGAPVAVLGLIEGIAEATASITKYPFGQAADYTGRQRPFVLHGHRPGELQRQPDRRPAVECGRPRRDLCLRGRGRPYGRGRHAAGARQGPARAGDLATVAIVEITAAGLAASFMPLKCSDRLSSRR
jgi:hypothetical protein